MATQATLDAVQKLYIGYLGRAADQSGLNFWADAIESGISTIESVATGFTLTQEYNSIYGNVSGSDLVEQIYQNIFGRASDSEGKAFWLNQLAIGTVTADTIALKMINIMGDVDKVLVEQKVVASNTYTQTAGANYNVEAGKNVLAEIGGGSQTPTPTFNVIYSGTGSNNITLTSVADKVVVAGGANDVTKAANLVSAQDAVDALVVTKVGVDATADEIATQEGLLNTAATTAQDNVDALVVTKVGVDATADEIATQEALLNTAATTAQNNVNNLVVTKVGVDATADEIATQEALLDTAVWSDFGLISNGVASDTSDPATANAYNTFAGLVSTLNGASSDKTMFDGLVSTLNGASSDKATFDSLVSTLTSANTDKATLDGLVSTLNGASSDKTTFDGLVSTLNSASTDKATFDGLVSTLNSAKITFDANFSASASPANMTDHDIITGFSPSADKLDLPETMLLTGLFSTTQTGNYLSITSNSNGFVEFGITSSSDRIVQSSVPILKTIVEEKVSALLTAMGAQKLTAAFVDGGSTYVVQGDGVAGVQDSDILIQLAGVSTATDLGAFIV